MNYICRLRKIARNQETTILYESCHRIIPTIKELENVMGKDRRICICRELTKMHETIIHCSLGEVGFRLVDKEL